MVKNKYHLVLTFKGIHVKKIYILIYIILAGLFPPLKACHFFFISPTAVSDAGSCASTGQSSHVPLLGGPKKVPIPNVPAPTFSLFYFILFRIFVNDSQKFSVIIEPFID